MAPTLNDSHTPTAASFPKETSAGDVVLVILALVLSVFIISVNSITIFVIRKTQHLHTWSNIYISSLAAADIVVGLGLLPLSMFYIPNIREKCFDHDINLCAFVLGINLGMATVSTVHMSLIATDRYLYIIWPYFYQRNVQRKAVYLVLCFTWIFGIFYALLPQIIHNDFSNVDRCDITLVMPKEYLFYATTSIYTSCVVVDVVMYSLILLTANKQRLIIRSTSISTESYNTLSRVSNGTIEASSQEAARASSLQEPTFFIVKETSQDEKSKPFNKNTQSCSPSEPYGTHGTKTSTDKPEARNSTCSVTSKNENSHLKSVKFFMTVFGVYFICVTPTVVCMCIDYYWRIPRIIYNAFNLLALLNSGMNFFILCVLNVRFRSGVMKLCQCQGVT